MTLREVDTPRTALQLYTLRHLAQQDLEAALDQAAAAGYRELEWFGGLWNRTTDELRQLLVDRRLSLAAAHVPLAELEADPASVMAAFRELGCEVLVCPWLDEVQRGDGSRAHYLELGHRLDLLSYRFRAGGFRFAYHNHEFELLPFDDGAPERPRDSLGEDGLRALVSCRSHDGWGLELDIYWAAFAGRDPASLIRDLGDRVHILHLKDGLLPGPAAGRGGRVEHGERDPGRATAERWFRPLGAGDVDVPGCVEAALDAGVRLFVVEQDETARAGGSPALDAAASLEHLRTATSLGSDLTARDTT